MTKRCRYAAQAHSQRGISLVLIAIALTTLIAAGALALDVGHLMISKTRLQDTVDAAALSAASTLNATSSTTLATASALAAFGLNASAAGNQELGSSYTNGSITVTVEYSNTLPPFTAGTTPAQYVRVKATGFTFATWLAQVMGITQLAASASAVAGASPTVNSACNLAPMMVCGTSTANPPPGTTWGYPLNAPEVLKSASPGSTQLGPGNFQLVQLGGSGADVVRQNLAGGYQACLLSGGTNTIQTQTGDETGPTAQGLNTRFGQYAGSMTMTQYPPDVLTTGQSPALTLDSSGNIIDGPNGTQVTSSNIDQLLYSYAHYSSDEGSPAAYQYQPVSAGGPGVLNRRVLSVIVGNCGAAGSSNGTTSIPILGFACYFLLQPVSGGGNVDYVYGQFIGNCDVNGDPGPAPVTGPGPYVIELYHDPDSTDS